MRTLLALGGLLLSASLLACGGSTADQPQPGTDAGADVDPGTDGGEVDAAPIPYPAPHQAPPKVGTYGGGTLKNPKIIPIFFQNDALQANLETFVKAIPGSTYWKATTAEYGVGEFSVGASIVLTEPAPTATTSDAIEKWLAAKLDGTHPEFPAVDVNNIYTVFYPKETIISEPNFGTSCKEYGGYHSETKDKNSAPIVYSVIPRCGNFGGFTGADAVTTTLSHELIEAATDPLAMTDPAYSIVDKDHIIWNVMPLGEIGDMCTYEPQNYPRIVAGFPATKAWSNAAALAGHDPCVPQATGEVYFNSTPVLTESVVANIYGTKIPTKGVKVPVGQSVTIDVQLFSDAPTDDWTVQAVDSTYVSGSAKELEFSWDKQLGNNGDVLKLTITRLKNGQYAGSELIIYSQKGPQVANLWFGFVAN